MVEWRELAHAQLLPHVQEWTSHVEYGRVSTAFAVLKLCRQEPIAVSVVNAMTWAFAKGKTERRARTGRTVRMVFAWTVFVAIRVAQERAKHAM